MGEKQVRWGLLSTARINERLIPCIRNSQQSELLAVASRNEQKVKRYAAEWDIPRAYGSYEQLIQDPDVDVVYISLPNSMHADWSIRCADSGKHVFCEKPLAISPDEVDRMSDAANRNGVIIQEAAMMRFHQQTSDVKRMLAEGVIGDVRLLRSVFSFYLTKDQDIRLDPDVGGGALWDLGSYQVSLSRTLFQAEPVEVSGWQKVNDKGVDRTFAGQMRFESGAISQFYCSNESAPAWDADLIGSTGLMHLDLPYQNHPGLDGHVRIHRGSIADDTVTFGDSTDQMDEETLIFRNNNAYQDEVDSMIASVLNGLKPVLSLEDSRANIVTILALLKSARERHPIQI